MAAEVHELKQSLTRAGGPPGGEADGRGGGGAGGAGGDGGGAETPPNNSQIKRTLQYNQGQMEDLRREQKQISADMHTVLKTLEAGQLVFQELENLKDKASRELPHQMGGLKEEAEVMRFEVAEFKANASRYQINQTATRNLREQNFKLQREIEDLNREKKDRKEFMNEQKERLEKLEADAEITRAENEDLAYRLADLEYEKEQLEDKLFEEKKATQVAKDQSATHAESAARIRVAEEGKYEAHKKTMQKQIDRLEFLLQEERAEKIKALAKVSKSGQWNLELEKVNKILVEEAMSCTNLEKAMQREIRKAKDELRAREGDVEALQNRFDKANGECLRNRAEIERLSSQLKASARGKEEAERAVHELRNVEDEVHELKGVLRDLKGKYDGVVGELDAANDALRQMKMDFDVFAIETNSTREEMSREVLAQVQDVRADLQESFRAAARDVEGFKIAIDQVKRQKERELFDAKSDAHSNIVKVETELTGQVAHLTREKEDLLRALQRSEAAMRSLIDKDKESARAHEALMQEIRAKCEELVQVKAEFEEKRRQAGQEKNDLERQLYVVSRDREETMSKFRAERNSWSDMLREAKLKTAKEEAQVRSKLNAVEADKNALAQKAHQTELNSKRLQEEVRSLKDKLRAAKDAAGHLSARSQDRARTSPVGAAGASASAMPSYASTSTASHPRPAGSHLAPNYNLANRGPADGSQGRAGLAGPGQQNVHPLPPSGKAPQAGGYAPAYGAPAAYHPTHPAYPTAKPTYQAVGAAGLGGATGLHALYQPTAAHHQVPMQPLPVAAFNPANTVVPQLSGVRYEAGLSSSTYLNKFR